MSGLDTYFLEVSAHALLATRTSFRSKKLGNVAILRYFSDAKTESLTKVNYVLS